MKDLKKVPAVTASVLLMAGVASGEDRYRGPPMQIKCSPADGVVKGLSRGDFLAVRSGSGSYFKQVDKLFEKNRVTVVGWSGEW
jgi:hypothetical protein